MIADLRKAWLIFTASAPFDKKWKTLKQDSVIALD
jgi:hypothetical protein